jgi:hypothetical protein
LYIKLDKKLIVEAKTVQLTQDAASSSSREELVKVLSYLPWIDRFFNTVSINTLRFQDRDIRITYKEETFYLDTTYMTIDATLDSGEEGLIVNVKQLFLKDFDLDLQGELYFDLLTEKGFFKGTFLTHGIAGNVALRLEDRLLSYVANTNTFHTLTPFMEALNQHVAVVKEANEWIYQRITAESYRLDALRGKLDLETGNFFPHEMSGMAQAKDVKVRFHDAIPPATIHDLKVELIDNQLVFHIGKAEYEGVDISDSDVYIYNLLTTKNGIIITLRANTKLNETVHQILRAYDIHIPVIQTSGTTDAMVMLDIDFLPYALDAQGTFHVKDAALEIAGTPFYSKEATLMLENTTVKLKEANLQYQKLFDVTASGTLETKTQTFEGNALVHHLRVTHNATPLLGLEGIRTPLHLDFSPPSLEITLPDFKATVAIGAKESYFSLNALELLLPYSPLLQEHGLKEGSIKIKTEDYENFNAVLHVNNPDIPLLKEGKPLKEVEIAISIKEGVVSASAPGVSLREKQNERSILIEGLDVLIKEETLSQQYTTPTTIHGSQSHFLLVDQNQSLPFKQYELLAQQGDLSLTGSFTKGTLSLYQTPELFEFSLAKADDILMNHFAKKEAFDGGIFNLELVGKSSEHYSGSLHLSQTHIREMVTYNNLIALINTLPSLAFFKGPGFNEKGYEIKEGNILFTREGDVLTLHAIDLDGISADIAGKGVVNLKDKTLHVTLKLKTFKEVSGILKYVPVVNYLVLGEDESIATAVTISGKLEDPQVTTQVLQDALMTPFNLIKRTIQMPFKLFSND